jgi:WD40 repeat protein
LDALVKATETGKMLKNTFNANEDIKIKVLTSLQQVVYGLNERNRLEGKGMNFSTVSFSPDGKIIASAGNNGTIKLWYSNGKLFQTLTQRQKDNSDKVFQVIFSNKGLTLISASLQGINIWQRQRNGSFNFYKSIPNQDRMMHLALSLDDKIIATADLDSKSTIKLWSLDGKLLNTLKGHSALMI